MIFDKFKKNGVKYLVFAINILLAAIAVLVIREKDQTRLLNQAQKENVGNESAGGDQLPSFKSSVNVEGANDASIPKQEPLVNSEAVVPMDLAPQNVVSPVPVPNTAPLTPAPAATKAKPSNAQTKTS